MSITDRLEDAPPAISAAEARDVAEQVFGLRVAGVHELPGERDRNFLLTAHDGVQFVLKIVHPAEDPHISDFQTRLLLHLADAGLPVPTIVPPADGRRPFVEPAHEPHATCFVRCVTYLPGRRMGEISPHGRRWRALGRFLARLDSALVDFSHPAADHPFLWDLKRADQVRPLAGHIRDEDRRRRVTAILDAFAAEARPRLASLRSQVIHNDGNPQNVLVDDRQLERIAGIIDFGDAVHAPVAQELAVAIAYQQMSEPEPFAAACEITRGYHAVSALSEDEIALLPALIATRLALTSVITAWRAALHPENGDYIMRNDPTIRANLEHIDALRSGDGPAWFAAQILDDTSRARRSA